MPETQTASAVASASHTTPLLRSVVKADFISALSGSCHSSGRSSFCESTLLPPAANAWGPGLMKDTSLSGTWPVCNIAAGMPGQAGASSQCSTYVLYIRFADGPVNEVLLPRMPQHCHLMSDAACRMQSGVVHLFCRI